MSTLNGKINIQGLAIAALGATVKAQGDVIAALQVQDVTAITAAIAALHAQQVATDTHLALVDSEIGTEADDAPAAPADTVDGGTGTDTVAGAAA